MPIKDLDNLIKQESYILHIASWYPTRVNIFDGDFIQRHIDCLDDTYKHIVIHVQIDKSIKPFSQEFVFEERNGKPTYILYFNPLVKVLSLPLRLIALNSLWNKVKEKHGIPKLSHVHCSLYGAWLGKRLKRKQGVPYVVTEHSTLYSLERPTIMQNCRITLARNLSHQASYYLPVSSHLAKNLSKKGFNHKMEVIPNVIPDYFFRESLSRSSDKTKFIHVSTLNNEHKNVSGILSAFKNLYEKGLIFELTLIGNANLKKTKKLIDQFNFPKGFVSLLGPYSHEQVAQKMKENDCFVLFSNYENFPCVLLEAQASGMYLISSDVGGISEIVKSKGDGLLVQKQDITSLKRVIRTFTSQKSQLVDKKSIRSRAKSLYSKSAVNKKMIHVYEKILHREYS